MRANVTFLIDAYNLMHAIGLAHRQMHGGATPTIAPSAHQLARHGSGASFRFGTVPRCLRCPKWSARLPRNSHNKAVIVHYAIGETADDAIEDRLAIEPDAPHWVVISNDMRLHESARRRGSESWSCQKFVDWLIDENAQTGVVVRTDREAERISCRLTSLRSWPRSSMFLESPHCERILLVAGSLQ